MVYNSDILRTLFIRELGVFFNSKLYLHRNVDYLFSQDVRPNMDYYFYFSSLDIVVGALQQPRSFVSFRKVLER